MFAKQIESGGPVILTHKNITRYFMSIKEAVGLVIQAGAMAKNGDLFVLDMGKPKKFLIWQKMIRFMDTKPEIEELPAIKKYVSNKIVINITGLRLRKNFRRAIDEKTLIPNTREYSKQEKKALVKLNYLILYLNLNKYCVNEDLTNIKNFTSRNAYRFQNSQQNLKIKLSKNKVKYEIFNKNKKCCSFYHGSCRLL